MKIDWNVVTREHVLKAIDLFLNEETDFPEAKTTFLIFNDKKLPAKHIRGIAYKIAHGKEISKQDYSGGKETVRFFEKLGFEIYYSGKTVESAGGKKSKPKTKKVEVKTNETELVINQPTKHNDSAVKIKIPSKGVIEQKNALQLILNKLYDGDIVCEKTFSWMKTPEVLEGCYKDLYEALHMYRGDSEFAKKNVSLRCDFVCESQKLIIEYDERQHFSKAREITLECYKDLPLCYDVDLWQKACSDINAKDNNPANRDEIRAYYDSVRDIEAAKNGYRLVRIMHGQIDFEKDDAKEQLVKILNAETSEKSGLKVALYLQTEDKHNLIEFKKAMFEVKKADIDLLVFPEISFMPFNDLLDSADIDNIDDIEAIYDECLSLSKEINCAVVIGSKDRFGTIYSVYANANCDSQETERAIYIKHTATEYSAFDFDCYENIAEPLFTPVILKGNRIGMTICYDCNHALFSRMYGVIGVDIIINCTGGNVVYDKWHKYSQSRAMENNCYTFTTMGGQPEGNSYVYGFSPSGKELTPRLINGFGSELNIPGGIYVYHTDEKNMHGEADRRLNQEHTKNKNIDFMLNSNKLTEILKSSVKIENNLYLYKYKDYDLVFIVVKNEDIFQAEKFLPLMYSEKLKKYSNKRYIIVNQFDKLDKELYENKLSVVLKVRAMENYCAVLLKSDLITMCYQTSKNKTAQALLSENGYYGLDLSRMNGPETIWKDKDYTKAAWRKGYCWLAKQCACLSEHGVWMKEY